MESSRSIPPSPVTGSGETFQNAPLSSSESKSCRMRAMKAYVSAGITSGESPKS